LLASNSSTPVALLFAVRPDFLDRWDSVIEDLRLSALIV